MSLLHNPFAEIARTEAERTRDQVRYLQDKVVGSRTPSGNLNPKRLSPIQRRIIALHVQGHSVGEISFLTGYSQPHIYSILATDVAKAYIELHCNAGVDQGLLGLLPLAVDAVRDGLRSEDMKTRLTAADRAFKATGRYEGKVQERETAEDVIARALEVMKTQADTVREVTRDRNMRVINGGKEPRSITNEATKLEEDDGISIPGDYKAC